MAINCKRTTDTGKSVGGRRGQGKGEWGGDGVAMAWMGQSDDGMGRMEQGEDRDG